MENFWNFNPSFACGILLMLIGPISKSYHAAFCKHRSGSIGSLLWGVVVLIIGLIGTALGLYLSLKEFFNVSIWDFPLIIGAFLIIRCINKRGPDFFSKHFFSSNQTSVRKEDVLEAESRKFWILIRNKDFLCFIQENSSVVKELEGLGFTPAFISQLTELKMGPEDKALVFMPETIEALNETPTPELWREFMFKDVMLNPSIYATNESELWRRITDGSIFARVREVIKELSK